MTIERLIYGTYQNLITRTNCEHIRTSTCARMMWQGVL